MAGSVSSRGCATGSPAKSLEAFGFDIADRKCESTVGVRRDDFSDDRLGIFKPMFTGMGRLAKRRPDEPIFELLAGGFVETRYDGRPFLSELHPSTDKAGAAITVSKLQTGAEPARCPLDTSRGLKPLVRQEREPHAFRMRTTSRTSRSS